MATRVGVIGLGDIGRGVAANFEKAGFDLVVCDVRPDATAQFEGRALIAASPEEIASAVDVVVIAVVNDAQLESVVAGDGGVLAGVVPGSAAPSILVLSTVGSETVRRMAEQAARVGSELVDCGVSGGPVAAAEGKLVAMVGGSEDAVARIRPVISAFASLVLHMGPPGAGLQAKLARNIVQYGSWLAAYEGQRLAEAAGIELSKLAQAIRESDVMIGGASRLMFRETVEPFEESANQMLVDAMRAGANLAHKDLQAALDLADQFGLVLPLTELTEEFCDSLFGLGRVVDHDEGGG